MSLFTRAGRGKEYLDEAPWHCHQVHITRLRCRPNNFQEGRRWATRALIMSLLKRFLNPTKR
ncbi:MAG: hypothetical protein R3B47_20370 [Bacteroidia bacterium]